MHLHTNEQMEKMDKNELLQKSPNSTTMCDNRR